MAQGGCSMERGQGPYSRGHKVAAAQTWGTAGLFWGQGESLAGNSAKAKGNLAELGS